MPDTVSAAIPFNRTSVELKQHLTITMEKGKLPFNRTSVELKLIHLSRVIAVLYPFNRTSVELKRSSACRDTQVFRLLIEPVWN